MEWFPARLPWYIAGPGIGLLVVALYALGNRRLGVTTSYLQTAKFFLDRPRAETGSVWYFVGLFAGSFVVALLRGGPSINLGYGALSLMLPLEILVVVLFAAGLVLGFGARWAGGCTSGHGISGSASLSPGSLVAMATFMAVAVALTQLVHIASGGAL